MIEIGCKYVITDSAAGNAGKIVTVIGYAGPAGFDKMQKWSGGDRYYIDQYLKTTRCRQVNHVSEDILQKLLPPKQEAAEQEWQADFKRLIGIDSPVMEPLK